MPKLCNIQHQWRTLRPFVTSASQAVGRDCELEQNYCKPSIGSAPQEAPGQRQKEISWEFSTLHEALVSLKEAECGPSSYSRNQAVKGGLRSFLLTTFAEGGGIVNTTSASLPAQCSHSWTPLIQQHVEHGDYGLALELYQKMIEGNVPPSRVALQSLLKACARLKDSRKGQELHVEVAREGYEKDPFVGSVLVDLYGKCGLLAEAQDVFNELPSRDVVMWTTLIAGYAEHGHGEEAHKCFYQMQSEGLEPNDVTFSCVLKACICFRAIDFCHQIHNEIAKEGYECNPTVASCLVSLYAKRGLLAEARDVFDELSVQNVVTWTALITQYGEQGLGEEAIDCFNHMKLQGVSPNVVTYSCILKAGGIIGIGRVQELHEEIVIEGFERDSWIGCILLDLYTKFNCLPEARDVLKEMPEKNVISWTALITGYVEHGFSEEALTCFEQMQLEGVPPNEVTYVSIAKGVGNMNDICKAQEIHAEIVQEGYEDDPFVGNSLLGMYVKCGAVAEAREVFDALQIRDVVSWNSLIAGYTEQGFNDEALNCLEQMQSQGVPMDTITFVCSLKACGSIGALSTGQKLHVDIVEEAHESFVMIGNTLLDMYAKCGLLIEAHEVFDELPDRDIVSFTALIDGYACQGEIDAVFCIFERMRSEGIKPDRVTFLSVLTACSHGGLLEMGIKHFDIFSKDCGVSPTLPHHNCLVDALGRTGRLSDIAMLLEAMPFQPNIVMWITVLGACWKFGDKELGRHAFECAAKLDENHSTPFVLMANIYADSHVRMNGVNIKTMEEPFNDLSFDTLWTLDDGLDGL